MNLKKDISNRLWFMEYTKLKKLIKALLLFKKLVGNWMFLCRYACRKIHNRWLIWNWWDRKLLCRYNIEHHIPLSPKMYADSIVKMNIKILHSHLFPVYFSIYPYLYWYVLRYPINPFFWYCLHNWLLWCCQCLCFAILAHLCNIRKS